MRYGRHYSRDPYWTTARFDSACSCGTKIKKGDRIFYYPNGKTAVCEHCGAKGQAEIDDDNLNQVMHCM
jgi:predicted SprT family Zn-dependent metalloprotease